MESVKITAFLITGPPGIGKTTLVRKVCAKLRDQIELQGFYTEEVRENGQRIGFDVVTLKGARGILSREKTADNQRRAKIGKYSVYLQDFENMVLPLGVFPGLMVLDEIGKMELLSKSFEAAVKGLLAQQQPMLATIPSQTRQPIPLVEQLKSFGGSKAFHVTKVNRNDLVNEITNQILKSYFT